VTLKLWAGTGTGTTGAESPQHGAGPAAGGQRADDRWKIRSQLQPVEQTKASTAKPAHTWRNVIDVSSLAEGAMLGSSCPRPPPYCRAQGVAAYFTVGPPPCRINDFALICAESMRKEDSICGLGKMKRIVFALLRNSDRARSVSDGSSHPSLTLRALTSLQALRTPPLRRVHY
jgi:hypothetical protein